MQNHENVFSDKWLVYVQSVAATGVKGVYHRDDADVLRTELFPLPCTDHLVERRPVINVVTGRRPRCYGAMGDSLCGNTSALLGTVNTVGINAYRYTQAG